MATGTIINPLDAYGLWFKPGDSFTVASGKGSYTGFLYNATTARCIIPLTKPVKPGTTVKIYGTFVVRCSQRTSITITQSDAIECTVTDCGLAVDITGATFGSNNEVCSIGCAGMTITFS